MTSPQNVKKIQNLLYPLVKDNFHLLSENVTSFAKNYLKFEFAYGQIEPFSDNYFCLDGSSDFNMAAMIREFDQHKDKLIIPSNFDKNGSTQFYNNAEGWCSKDIFYVIEWLIDVYELTGDCYYQNISCNNQEMYDRYIAETGRPKKIKKLTFSNEAFINDKSRYYSKPSVPIVEVDNEQKKLYCAFNWNGRPHRFGLISYLHYKDLINDGYITSPGMDKYSYNPEQDFELLVRHGGFFFDNDSEKDEIVSKLNSLKNNYPLKIDDRTKTTDTDTLLFDLELKAPLWAARTNSLFEIIPETFYTGEHMLSEKTFTPMVLKKPFFLLGSYNGLATLKKLGFRTFHDYFDESYDDEKDGIIRLKKIVNEVVKLKVMRATNPKLFYDWYDSMKEILEHNSTHFWSLKC